MLKRRFWRNVLYIAAIVVLLSLPACSDDNGTVADPTAGAPSLLGLSTMIMDLSFFGVGGSGIGAVNHTSDAAAAKANWIEAAVRVLYVYLTFYDAFEEPIGAFAAAIHSIPQSQPDGSWLWTFIFVEDDTDYSIFLYGHENDDHVDWRMEVSSNNPFLTLDHFKWFDGQSQMDESSGFWQFYNPVLTASSAERFYMASMTPGVPSVRVGWQHTPPGNHTLSVLVNEVGSPDENDTLTLTEDQIGSAVDFYDADMQELHNVTWYPDGSGNLTVPDYNGGLMACWDTKQENTICP